MIRRACFGLLLLACIALPAHADCSSVAAADSMIAEIANLEDWTALHALYPDLRPCDDGDVAEMVSDFVVSTFAHSWALLPQLARYEKSDAAFVGWVLKHVDATTDEDELNSIVRQAQAGGPPKLAPLRRRVEKAARHAIAEMQDYLQGN